MKIFISGTDTNIGKTLISSWLALHTGFPYFKPIQSGSLEGKDSETVHKLSGAKIYPEIFCYKEPVSPHLAASLEKDEINLEKITLPDEKNLIIEGAGGLLVPLNKEHMMIDLIQKLNVPLILVVKSQLGTINHTLLSLEALKGRGLEILGIIMNGPLHPENKKAIEFYGHTDVLAEFPPMAQVNAEALKIVPLSQKLKERLNRS